MQIISTAFKNNGYIPSQYTCAGENINPDFEISGIPKNAKSLSLIVDDPDDVINTRSHWIVFNIPPGQKLIKENSIPGKVGLNDFGKLNYGGPCPPIGIHRYHFKIYALDTELPLNSSNISKRELEKAQEGHILDQAEIVAFYFIPR